MIDLVVEAVFVKRMDRVAGHNRDILEKTFELAQGKQGFFED